MQKGKPISRSRKLNCRKLSVPDQQPCFVPLAEVTTDDLEYTDVVKKITVMVGVPKNYGLSPEEQEEVDRKKEKLRRQTMAAEAAENKRRNETALAAMAAPYEEWVRTLRGAALFYWRFLNFFMCR